MIEFQNIYDFYELSDEEAAKLIGQVIQEPVPMKDKRQQKKYTHFFPVGLTDAGAALNYGRQTGLIRLSKIESNYTDNQSCFRVSAFSPDDLDLGVFIEHPNATQECHKKVFELMTSLPFEDVSYEEILELVIQHIGCGKIEY